MKRRFWIMIEETQQQEGNLPEVENQELEMTIMMHCNDGMTNQETEDLPAIWKEIDQKEWIQLLQGRRAMDQSTTMEIFYLREEECHEPES